MKKNEGLKVMMLKENAITLVALIITIIVLIIIGAISIYNVVESGIVDKIISGTEKYTKEQIKEMDIVDNIDSNMEELENKIEKIEELKVGDYIEYQPGGSEESVAPIYTADKLVKKYTGSDSNTKDITRDNNMKWQILRIYDDGKIDIIGSTTQDKLYICGATGYNNGVYIMNEICETLYSRGKIKARSVNIEDFESSKGNWKKEKEEYIKNYFETELKNGSGFIQDVNMKDFTVTYQTRSSYYPNIYAQEIGSGIDTSPRKDGLAR